MGDSTEQTLPWLPVNLSAESRELVQAVARRLDYDLDETPAFVVALLEEVNLHKEAREVNDLLQGLIEQES